MTLPIIIFTSLLAGISAAAMFWFGADFVYRLRYSLEQRRRAKKLTAKEDVKGKNKDKGKGK